MGGICDLHDDKLARIERTLEKHEVQFEDVKTSVHEIEKKLAAWAVYLAIGATVFGVVGTYMINSTMAALDAAIAKQNRIQNDANKD